MEQDIHDRWLVSGGFIGIAAAILGDARRRRWGRRRFRWSLPVVRVGSRSGRIIETPSVVRVARFQSAFRHRDHITVLLYHEYFHTAAVFRLRKDYMSFDANVSFDAIVFFSILVFNFFVH